MASSTTTASASCKATCKTPCVNTISYVRLPQPPLLDFSQLTCKDRVEVVICNALHKFSRCAEAAGQEVGKQPIFGSQVIINGQKVSELSFGLPFMRFPQGSKPRIEWNNQTRYTSNIHIHGLESMGAVDGGSMEVVFGHSTQLGPKVVFQYPEVKNNQCLLWMHAHTMFLVAPEIYAGFVGLVQITDKATKWLQDDFCYGDNQLLLLSSDMDLSDKGTPTFDNLPTDENRSCFSVVNGVSVVNWYDGKAKTESCQAKGEAQSGQGGAQSPYVETMFHMVSRNLVKVDVANASANWRVFYLGVCDRKQRIKSFYYVQTDTGLVNPQQTCVTYVPVAGRAGILFDLNDFDGHEAYLFFYNYDLTEVFGSMPTYPDQPNNPSITGTIPDMTGSTGSSANPTPYPTPIPDPNQQNQQQDYTSLDYPNVPIIAQTDQVLLAGGIVIDPKSPAFTSKKIFLKIAMDEKSCKADKTMSMSRVLRKIRETVFGEKNYETYKQLIKKPGFEYQDTVQFNSLLNPKYYYNLPDFEPVGAAVRNIFLFPEVDTNAIAGGNPNGTTEYVDGANRIMCDLWNSAELDLDWALQQYQLSPNQFKPPVLPTSKFRIYKTDDRYSNTAMISNDTLKIQIFSQQIAYGDLSAKPLAMVTVVFPPTKPCELMNIEQWTTLVNTVFQQTECLGTTLNKILTCDWAFFPYVLDFLYDRTAYIKSAVIKTTNQSQYWIRLLARWPLLQFFGKPMTGSTLSPPSSSSSSTSGSNGEVLTGNLRTDLMAHLRQKQHQRHEKIANMKAVLKQKKQQLQQAVIAGTGNQTSQASTQVSTTLPPLVNNLALYKKCDEFATYGIYDADIQQLFPFYATSDGDVQLPIACMKRDAELIIAPESTYLGLYDGYLNDNLNSFSVKVKSTENWIYTNGDCADAHSLHFHLTSGYVVPNSAQNTAGLVGLDRAHSPLVYPRDVYQIGPQQTLGFYLRWPHYSSSDTTQEPPFRNVGGLCHCHLASVHESSNAMIVQYFVQE